MRDEYAQDTIVPAGALYPGSPRMSVLDALLGGPVPQQPPPSGAALTTGYLELEAFDALAGVDLHDSTAAWQMTVLQAVADRKVLQLRAGRTYLVAAAAVATLGAAGTLVIRGNGATIKLAYAALVNNNVSYNNFVELLRVEGGALVDIQDVIFDHNRDEQFYPPTPNGVAGTGRDNPGRGTQPRRTNGAVIVCSDGVNRPQRVNFQGCGFLNGYLSGLMLVQVRHATVTGCFTANNTINGVGGASLESLLYADNISYRDGASLIGLTSARSPYDRCALQIRDLPRWITATEAGFPMIAMSAASEQNGTLHASRNRVIEPGAIGLFMRGCTRGVMDHNFVLNPGYERKLGAPYNPYALWCDFGAWTVTDNDLVCERVASGDMPPDGIYLANWTGDGTDQGDALNGLQNMPIQGEYLSQCARNKIRCGQANNATIAYTLNSQKKNNWRKGIIAWSMSDLDDNFIEGTSEEPVELINDTNYTTDFLHDVAVRNNTFVNVLGDSLIKLTDFGSPSTGKPKNLKITGNKGRDLRSLTPGTDARQCIRFSPDWATVALEEVTVADNEFDCAWTGDVTSFSAGQTWTVGQVIANATPRYYVVTAVGALATVTAPSHTSGAATVDGYTYTHFGLPVDVRYNGVRLYNSSASKLIKVNRNNFRNVINAVRCGNLGDFELCGNTVDTGARLLFWDLTGGASAGVIRIQNNTTKSLTTNAFTGTMAGFQLGTLIQGGNYWAGSGTTTGLTMTTDVGRWIYQGDDDEFTTRKFPRTFHAAAAPTSGVYIVGDFARNTAPSAGGAIGWLNTTAGSPGTWSAIADDVVSVKDFGAVGDGTANDTAAFVAAIASGAKHITVPEPSGGGFYSLTSGLTIPAGVELVGLGTKPKLKFTTQMTNCILASGDGGILRNLTIDADKATKSSTNQGVNLSTYNDWLIDDCDLVNARTFNLLVNGARNRMIGGQASTAHTNGGGIGLRGTACIGNRIERVYCNDNGTFGIWVEGGANRNTLTGNWCDVSGLELIGVTFECHQNIIASNRSRYSGDNGISVTGYLNVVTGNICEEANFSGIGLYGARNSVTGNVIINPARYNHENAAAVAYAGILLTPDFGGFARRNSVSGNTLVENRASAACLYPIKLGTSGYAAWPAVTAVAAGSYYATTTFRVYRVMTGGTTSSTEPSHEDYASDATINGVVYRYCGSNCAGYDENVTLWAQGQVRALGARCHYNNNVYRATIAGTTGATPPTHTSSTASDGGVTWAIVSRHAANNNACDNELGQNYWQGFQTDEIYLQSSVPQNSIVAPGLIQIRIPRRQTRAFIRNGSGLPSTALLADPVGSLYIRSDQNGALGRQLYMNYTSNTGGWLPIYPAMSDVTGNRPTLGTSEAGLLYNDTTLNKMVRWSGTAWTNVDGTAL